MSDEELFFTSKWLLEYPREKMNVFKDVKDEWFKEFHLAIVTVVILIKVAAMIHLLYKGPT